VTQPKFGSGLNFWKRNTRCELGTEALEFTVPSATSTTAGIENGKHAFFRSKCQNQGGACGACGKPLARGETPRKSKARMRKTASERNLMPFFREQMKKVLEEKEKRRLITATNQLKTWTSYRHPIINSLHGSPICLPSSAQTSLITVFPQD
jgi:hypothetical protein